MRRAQLIVVAVAAGLALADSSIVALALPPLLTEFNTSITGVAAVIGVYTLVLAVGIWPAAWLARRLGAAHVGAIGMLVFAGASIGCALSDTLTTLLIFRAIQAAGGAAGLLAGFDLMDAGGHDASLGRRLWIAAAVFGSAAGPAIGGALTEALDWRAIFVAQAPIGIAAAIACWSLPVPAPGAHATGPIRWRPTIALAAISAALTAVLFLLVLQLVAGWSIEPLSAALTVTVLPVAAIAASRIRGTALVRASCGCLFVVAGAVGLAYLPDAELKWTILPQVLAGIGMGLAFPALAGGMLPERTSGDAARLLIARHAGIVVALLVLAPVVAHQLDTITETARYQGVAVVLDAKLDPRDKIALAPALMGGIDSDDPRGGLQDAIDRNSAQFVGEDAVIFDGMANRLDDVIVAAVGKAFKPAYLITAALALAAALVLVVGVRFRAAALATTTAVALLCATWVVVAIRIDDRNRPAPVVLADPCQDRQQPDSGGIFGAIQDFALNRLDRAACEFGSSREELVLALADDAENKRFQAKYHEDPRSVGGILEGLFG